MHFEKDPHTGREIFNAGMLVDVGAQRWGKRVAVYHYETGAAITYEEVRDMANRVGNGLLRIGVRPGDRVAILMDDCPEWVYSFFGTLKTGAIVSPLNTLLSEADYAAFLSDMRASALFVGASYFEKVRGIISSLPCLKRVVVHGGEGNEAERKGLLVDWAEFVQGASSELEPEPTFSADMALFVYTSGATGRPKAIVHSHTTLKNSLSISTISWGIGEGDIQFHIAKLYFMTSLAGLTNTFWKGASIVLLSGRPLGRTILEVIARYRPTFLAGPPTVYARMVDAAKEVPHLADLSSVRYIFCTGEALSVEVFKAFKDVFGKPLYNCWGAQEIASAPLGWLEGQEVPLDKVGSVGRLVLPEVEVKLVDEQGNEVPDGLPGELMVRLKESGFLGYWHEPQEAPQKFVEGWYKSGDLFVRDKDGYYWPRGRLDDLVKVGGRRVYPVEVEGTVSRHPAVAEAAVIPVTNPHGLTELQAFVVLKKGYDPSPELASDIQDFVKRELAPFKRPKYVEFVPELPKTSTGKIQRFRLREMVAAQKR